MGLTVLGIGADPRIFKESDAIIKVTPRIDTGLVLTYQEQPTDNFGVVGDLFDLLSAIDCFSFLFH